MTSEIEKASGYCPECNGSAKAFMMAQPAQAAGLCAFKAVGQR